MTGMVVMPALSTLLVKALDSAARAIMVARISTRPTSISSGLTGTDRCSPMLPPIPIRAAISRPSVSEGTAVPSRISMSRASPVRSRLRTSSVRRAT